MFDWQILAFKKHRFGWTRLICPRLYLNYQTQHSHMYNRCAAVRSSESILQRSHEFLCLSAAGSVFGLSPAFPQQLWKSLKPPQTHNWLSFCHYGPHEGPDCWRGTSASETVPWRGRESRLTEGPHMSPWTGDPPLTQDFTQACGNQLPQSTRSVSTNVGGMFLLDLVQLRLRWHGYYSVLFIDFLECIDLRAGRTWLEVILFACSPCVQERQAFDILWIRFLPSTCRALSPVST